MTASTLKPLSGPRLTYWFSGGDIIWCGDGRPTPLHPQNVEGLLDLFDTVMRAACAAGEVEQAVTYGELFAQLSKAREAQDKWRRATNVPPVEPFQTAGKVVGHIIMDLPNRDAA